MKQIRDWAGIIGFAIVVTSGLVGSDRSLAKTDLPEPRHQKLSASATKLAEDLLKARILAHKSYSPETAKTANPIHIKQLQETGVCPRCNLRGADLKGLDLSRFYKEDVITHVVISRPNLNAADLSNADLSKALIMGSNLRGANLSNAKLYPADLVGADLRGADLRGADLKWMNWTGIKIDANTKISQKWRLVWEIVNYGAQGKDLSGMDFRDASLQYDSLWGERHGKAPNQPNLRGANFRGADLSGVFLRDVDLENANLSGANLQGALMIETNLRRANLTYSNLKDVIMMRTDISYANLRGAKNYPNTASDDCGAILPNGIVVESPLCP
jgi:uncharacterized protein YjbI with pentapeptide repeats